MKKLFVLITSSLLITSCSAINTLNYNEGIAYFKINFPNKFSFNIKAIPKTTDSIRITITGEGLDEPKILNVSKDENNVMVTKLPEGRKFIEVLALNSKKNIVAEGKSEVIIEKLKIKTVEVELKPTSIADIDPSSLLDKLSISLKNVSNDMDSILEIKKDNFTIIKEFNGEKIELNNVPTGIANIKVTSLKDGLPMFNYLGKVNIDKENIEISLERIDYQESYELDESQTIPPILSDFLKRVLIDSPINNKPFIENIEVTVNNQRKSFGFINPICINSDDKLKIMVNAVDKDNDKLTYLWGISEPKEGNFLIPKYDMKLQNERSNVLERNVNFKKGRVFIGFVITDKKSFVSFTVPFLVSDQKCN
jgi:hypothetical protein